MVVCANDLGGFKFDEGWSVRPKIGTHFGSITVQNHMKDITSWYEIGNSDKGKKMSGAQMQSALELKYPERYDITTEQHIKNAINVLNQSKRKNKLAIENGKRSQSCRKGGRQLNI